METQQSKKRFRGPSIDRELIEALSFAKSLEKLDADDALAISRMKLSSQRIVTLTLLSNRKRHDKLRKVSDKLKAAHREIEKLKVQLTAATAAKPITVSEISEIEKALAKYNASKGGAQ
jgi:uncharacterized membrane protein YukC